MWQCHGINLWWIWTGDRECRVSLHWRRWALLQLIETNIVFGEAVSLYACLCTYMYMYSFTVHVNRQYMAVFDSIQTVFDTEVCRLVERQQHNLNSFKHNIIDHITELAFDWWSSLILLLSTTNLKASVVSRQYFVVYYMYYDDY